MTRLGAVGSRGGAGRVSSARLRVDDVQIAGVELSPGDVEELAQRLAHGGAFDTSLHLLRAFRENHDSVELDEGEMQRVVEVLENPPPAGLTTLRGVLLEETRLRPGAL